MNSLCLQDLAATYRAPVEVDFHDPALTAEMRRRVPDWTTERGEPKSWTGVRGIACGPEGCRSYDPLVARLSQLSPAAKREVAARAIEWGVQRGVADWIEANGRGVAGLGQDAITGAVALAVQRALEPLMPALKQQLLEIAEPAARKAADVVGPVIEEKLRDYGPTLAAITGIVAAVLSIVGMLLLGGYLKKALG